MLETVVCYAVGTLFGYLAFRNMNRESIITRTLDTLIEDEFVRSWQDDEGQIHLYKWYEIEDLIEDMVSNDGEENEKDDTP